MISYDAYALVSLCKKVNCGEELIIDGSDEMVIKAEDCETVVGYIPNMLNYTQLYEVYYNIMNILLRDNMIQLTSDNYDFFDFSNGIIDFLDEELLCCAAKVVYSDENIAIVDLKQTICVYDDEEELITDELAQEEREEEINMNNLLKGFGKCVDPRFALSINGIAVAQERTGKYVVYNKETNEFVDVNDTLISIKDALFTLPTSEITVGDTVIHENKPYYIIDTTNGIKAVSYDDCVEATLIPKTTMFGVKYFTKVFSLFGDQMKDLLSNPMMLMTMMNGKDVDLTKILMLNSLSGKNEITSNPILLSMLMKDKDSDLSNLVLMSMINGGTNPFAPKSKK